MFLWGTFHPNKQLYHVVSWTVLNLLRKQVSGFVLKSKLRQHSPVKSRLIFSPTSLNYTFSNEETSPAGREL